MTGVNARIANRFADLHAAGRGGLIPFLTAGDPDFETSMALLRGLPAAGADLIELGMPFSDPMADGPAIQASSQRALKRGQTLAKTLEMVAAFRRDDTRTPVILMGYYNPIYVRGAKAFAREAAAAGVDGLIIVDLPPEEAAEMVEPTRAAGLDLIFLTAPTTNDRRLPLVVADAGGFIYYVSIMGITGTMSAAPEDVARAVARIRGATDLPVAVGFGIKTPDQAATIAGIADAAVVGSALVRCVEAHLDADGVGARPGLVDAVLGLVGDLSAAVRAPTRESVR